MKKKKHFNKFLQNTKTIALTTLNYKIYIFFLPKIFSFLLEFYVGESVLSVFFFSNFILICFYINKRFKSILISKNSNLFFSFKIAIIFYFYQQTSRILSFLFFYLFNKKLNLNFLALLYISFFYLRLFYNCNFNVLKIIQYILYFTLRSSKVYFFFNKHLNLMIFLSVCSVINYHLLTENMSSLDGKNKKISFFQKMFDFFIREMIFYHNFDIIILKFGSVNILQFFYSTSFLELKEQKEKKNIYKIKKEIKPISLASSQPLQLVQKQNLFSPSYSNFQKAKSDFEPLFLKKNTFLSKFSFEEVNAGLDHHIKENSNLVFNIPDGFFVPVFFKTKFHVLFKSTDEKIFEVFKIFTNLENENAVDIVLIPISFKNNQLESQDDFFKNEQYIMGLEKNYLKTLYVNSQPSSEIEVPQSESFKIGPYFFNFKSQFIIPFQSNFPQILKLEKNIFKEKLFIKETGLDPTLFTNNEPLTEIISSALDNNLSFNINNNFINNENINTRNSIIRQEEVFFSRSSLSLLPSHQNIETFPETREITNIRSYNLNQVSLLSPRVLTSNIEIYIFSTFIINFLTILQYITNKNIKLILPQQLIELNPEIRIIDVTNEETILLETKNTEIIENKHFSLSNFKFSSNKITNIYIYYLTALFFILQFSSSEAAIYIGSNHLAAKTEKNWNFRLFNSKNSFMRPWLILAIIFFLLPSFAVAAGKFIGNVSKTSFNLDAPRSRVNFNRPQGRPQAKSDNLENIPSKFSTTFSRPNSETLSISHPSETTSFQSAAEKLNIPEIEITEEKFTPLKPTLSDLNTETLTKKLSIISNKKKTKLRSSKEIQSIKESEAILADVLKTGKKNSVLTDLQEEKSEIDSQSNIESETFSDINSNISITKDQKKEIGNSEKAIKQLLEGYFVKEELIKKVFRISGDLEEIEVSFQILQLKSNKTIRQEKTENLVLYYCNCPYKSGKKLKEQITEYFETKALKEQNQNYKLFKLDFHHVMGDWDLLCNHDRSQTIAIPVFFNQSIFKIKKYMREIQEFDKEPESFTELFNLTNNGYKNIFNNFFKKYTKEKNIEIISENEIITKNSTDKWIISVRKALEKEIEGYKMSFEKKKLKEKDFFLVMSVNRFKKDVMLMYNVFNYEKDVYEKNTSLYTQKQFKTARKHYRQALFALQIIIYHLEMAIPFENKVFWDDLVSDFEKMLRNFNYWDANYSKVLKIEISTPFEESFKEALKNFNETGKYFSIKNLQLLKQLLFENCGENNNKKKNKKTKFCSYFIPTFRWRYPIKNTFSGNKK